MKGETLQGGGRGNSENVSGRSAVEGAGSSVLEEAGRVVAVIKGHWELHNYLEAYEAAFVAVEKFGFRMPWKKMPPLEVLLQGGKVKCSVRNWSQACLEWPWCEDLVARASIQVACAALPAIMRVDSRLGYRVAAWCIGLGERYGKTPEAIRAYAYYGLIYNNGQVGSRGGGEGALRLILAMAREGAASIGCRAEAFYSAGMFPLSSGISSAEATEYLREGVAAGQESGDSFHEASARVGLVMGSWMKGNRLTDLWGSVLEHLPALERSGEGEALAVVRLIRQGVLGLQGKLPDPPYLDDDSFDEGQFLGDLAGFRNPHFAQFSYLFCAYYCCLVGRPTAARAHIHNSRENLESASGMFAHAEHYFLEGLLQILVPEIPLDLKTFNQSQDFLLGHCGKAGDYSMKGEFLRAGLKCRNGKPTQLVQVIQQAAERGNQAMVALGSSLLAGTPGAGVSSKDKMDAWVDYGLAQRLDGSPF